MVEAKTKRGGMRPGAGRPALFREPMERYHVNLDHRTVAICIKLGNGNLSEGIRLAAEMVEKQSSAD